MTLMVLSFISFESLESPLLESDLYWRSTSGNFDLVKTVMDFKQSFGMFDNMNILHFNS